MTYSNYRKRLLSLQKRKNLGIGKANIQAHIIQSSDEQLVITNAQSIKKEEFIFRNFVECDSSESENIDSEEKSFQDLLLSKISELTKEVKDMKQEIIKLKNETPKSKQNIPRIRLPEQASIELPHILPRFEQAESPERSSFEMLLELPIVLPISNHRDLKALIDWVTVEENKHMLALALIIEGPFSDYAAKVRTTLRKLISGRMAVLFNWEGRTRVNGPAKTSFLTTGLWPSVVMAINHDEEISESKAEVIAKLWFKGANAIIKKAR